MVCDLKKKKSWKRKSSLNPYSIGIWSATEFKGNQAPKEMRLNPYSIGIWSATRAYVSCPYNKCVLILILLEYGLRPFYDWRKRYNKARLNPYSIGIWSATPKIANH